MVWNWQRSDWPHFSWDAGRLARAEERFLLSGGVLVGVTEHLAPPERDRLLVQLMTDDAADTSEIEGELLDRTSVQSSIQRRLGLSEPDRDAGRSPTPAENGVAEMTVDLYQRWEQPLTARVLFDWHAMLMKGRPDLRTVGGYRKDPRPMQIISGRLDRPAVHFEAVPTERVATEMDRFVEWFGATGPGGGTPLPAVTRAGIAHLYFESIHPFEDGNGRLGRAISEKALAQGLGRPVITALASTILVRKKQYYDALAAASRTNEITGWLAWFAGVTLEAQQRTRARAEFVLASSRLLRETGAALNPRQLKALRRMFREGPDGFRGGMSHSKYAAITGAESATTRRDLANLVEIGVFTRTGERKGTRYHLSIPLRQIGPVVIAGDGAVIEPAPDR
jgi:Fic family protein